MMATNSARIIKSEREGMAHALPLIDIVCRLAVPIDFIAEGRASLARQGVIGAVRNHDTNRVQLSAQLRGQDSSI